MTRTLRPFQLGNIDTGFLDLFNDSSIHPAWTVDITALAGTDPTITEDGTGLTIGYVGGEGVTLTYPAAAPCIHMPLEPRDFTIKVCIENLPAANSSAAGIANYHESNKSLCHTLVASNSGGNNTIVYDYNLSNPVSVGGFPETYVWLALLRRGDLIDHFYLVADYASEPDLEDMIHINYYSRAFEYFGNRIALYGESFATTFPAISPKFKKFHLTYST